MKKGKIIFDLDLAHSIYKSNNDILIRISKRNLEWSRNEFNDVIQNIITAEKGSPISELDQDLSELMHIDWIFLNSIYISLFTNFENQVAKLASIVEGRIGSDERIKNIKANGYIEQYRKFMYSVGGIKNAQKNRGWREIDVFRLVRNKLVHNKGLLNSNPSEKLEDRTEYQFLVDNKVNLAGSLGHIRIRETYFLEKFVTVSSKLCDELKLEVERLETKL